MKKRLLVSLAILLLVVGAVGAAPMAAGSRVTCGREYSTEHIMNERFVDGLSVVRVKCRRTQAVGTFMALEFYDGASWLLYGAAPVSDDLSVVTMSVNPVTYSLARELPWRLRAWSASAPVWVEWYELVDVYGDPAFELSLLEQIAGKRTLAESTTVTDTLTSGNVWSLDRTFTYGEITSAIAMSAVALLSFLGLLARVTFTR